MYPNEIIFGLGLYEIMIILGFIGALIYFRIFADRMKFSATLQNICIIAAPLGLIGGYGMAVLTQAVYNAIETGHFELNKNTGSTFYGGLIGGIISFLIVYFVAGSIKLGFRSVWKSLGSVSEIAAGAIAVAHGCGRIGCLCAGCCHGAVTDRWYGIYNASLGCKTVPIQLYEALFLFALCAFLSWRLVKGRRGNMPVYLMLYAVWRFFIEYFRGDDRGETIVSFLSPSQLTAIILFLIGAAVFTVMYVRNRKSKTHEA